ncbi:NFATC2-interacting protein [Stylophora pistillata]|uniref:NFATC2-interacting protein n=1 Tax=Stylophora pistillata TaxID=50429 RepID=A0A2B4S5P7_STYPI|nr:NFATC2-interacting protein [Stylophora pistillata]
MSGNEDQTSHSAVSRPRKVLRKRQSRDDIFSYRGKMALSFKAKQVKLQDSDSSGSDDDEAFHRMHTAQYTKSDSSDLKNSDSEDDLWVTKEMSVEEINSSENDIKETYFRRSPTPPPAWSPELSEATKMRINLRQNKKLKELDIVLDSLKRSTKTNWASPDSQLSSSVICESDSDGFPSPSERDVAVKVRTRSGIKRFTTKAAEPFGKIISQLAQLEGVSEDKIMLSLADINILGYDTPISIHLSVADIIGLLVGAQTLDLEACHEWMTSEDMDGEECVVIDKPILPDSVEEDENSIEIKVQGKEPDSKKTFRILKTDQLEKLMTAYCEYRKLPRSRIKFLFDGEDLKGGETPEQLDMEHEDVIDVQVK